jgi:fatty-acyl-CoA synthase
MTDRAHLPVCRHSRTALLRGSARRRSPAYDWPQFDEHTASSLCYTSGTTGNPKGVLYSHRSSVLHSWAACATDGLAVGAAETVLLVVPMFHVNAWGMPYAGAMSGARLVMPGPALDGKSVYELMRDEQVTLALGVPTVWLMLLQYVDGGRPEAQGRTVPAARRHRRLIGAARDERSASRRFRRFRRPRLGNDRDVAAGHGLQPAARHAGLHA